MPDTAELVETQTSDGGQRVRKRRNDLIPRLEELAYNLRWSWDPLTLDLFQSLAPEPWARTHNPIVALKSSEHSRLSIVITTAIRLQRALKCSWDRLLPIR